MILRGGCRRGTGTTSRTTRYRFGRTHSDDKSINGTTPCHRRKSGERGHREGQRILLPPSVCNTVCETTTRCISPPLPTMTATGFSGAAAVCAQGLQKLSTRPQQVVLPKTRNFLVPPLVSLRRNRIKKTSPFPLHRTPGAGGGVNTAIIHGNGSSSTMADVLNLLAIVLRATVHTSTNITGRSTGKHLLWEEEGPDQRQEEPR